jgi:phosphoglycerol transferase MdoB-like AlkP superfamily enzyme
MNLSFKNFYWRWIKNQLLMFVIMLILMTGARLAFSFLFGSIPELESNQEDFKTALFLGLRYDLIPIAYINMLPFIVMNLGYFIPGKFAIKSIHLCVRTVLFLGYMLLVWLYIFDYAFYSYFQDHLNILFFGFFEDDTIAVLTSIWKNYNLPLWLGIIFVGHIAFFKLLKFLFSPFDFDLESRKFDLRMLMSFSVGLVLLAFFARGNFGRLPLSLEDAHISTNEFINKVSLNGVVTFNRALKIRKNFGTTNVDYLKQFGFKDWQDAFRVAFNREPKGENLIDDLKVKTSLNEELTKRPPHVVLVVMESFGSYWNEKHSEKFNILGSLEDHFKEGILFKNFLPAENGTIGSIVSVATSQVIRPGARFLSESDFMRTPLQTAGHLPYKEAGYETHFLYGGKLGWRDLGKYLAIQRYDNLWGADEVKEAMPELNNIEERDLGNEWGIFDEYLYTFIEEQLRTATKPQFFLVLTTSNHPPFEYPSSYNTLPLDLNSDLLEQLTVTEDMAKKRFLGLQYGNQKMGEFLSKIKKSSLNDKVVVALTGDHSYWIAKGVGHEDEFKRYAVPFYLKVPERIKPRKWNPNNFGSHEDIFPTLYHLTLSGREYVKLGENLLGEEGIALNSSGLAANSAGAFHHNSFWGHANQQDQILKQIPENEDLKNIRDRSRSLIGLTDLYLKQEKARTQSVSKSGQR